MAQSKHTSKKLTRATAKKKPVATEKRAAKPSPTKYVPTKKPALGRGLKALLVDSNAHVPTPAQGMEMIALSAIELNPYQPRTRFGKQALQELAESIAVHGIIQPITVRALYPGHYQLISGERRLLACRQIEQAHIPAFVRTVEDNQMLEMAIIENIQREALNAIEIALSYQRLLSECGLKQDELAKRMGKERSTVTNYLRLLRLPPSIQVALKENRISMGHARSLLAIPDEHTQLLLLKDILDKQLSVRQTETATRKLAPKKRVPKKLLSPPEDYKKLQKNMVDHLGTTVRIWPAKEEAGEIRITFSSTKELHRLIALLQP